MVRGIGEQWLAPDLQSPQQIPKLASIGNAGFRDPGRLNDERAGPARVTHESVELQELALPEPFESLSTFPQARCGNPRRVGGVELAWHKLP
jgi:hypothetical protein